MPSFAQQWTLLALVLTLLAACETVNSNPACVCPPVKEYSQKFQRKLADEVQEAAIDAVFPQALIDYALLRKQNEACKN